MGELGRIFHPPLPISRKTVSNRFLCQNIKHVFKREARRECKNLRYWEYETHA